MASTRLVLDLELDIILGCFDMLSVYGGDTEGKSIEEIVSQILKAQILGMRDDSFIPSYESEADVLKRMEETFPGIFSKKLEVLKEITDEVESKLSEDDSMSSLRTETNEKEITEAVVDSENETDDKTNETSEGTKPPLKFSQLPEKIKGVDDDLVREAKGDQVKEESLVEIYSRLPQEMWGSENARKMWELVLSKKEIPTTDASISASPTEVNSSNQEK